MSFGREKNALESLLNDLETVDSGLTFICYFFSFFLSFSFPLFLAWPSRVVVICLSEWFFKDVAHLVFLRSGRFDATQRPGTTSWSETRRDPRVLFL
jgi:hypothetical protein